MKHFSLVLLLFCASLAHALTIPQGIIYFDNSQTQWSSVQFVYGTSSWTKVVTLTADPGSSTFFGNIPSQELNVDRYCFANSSLPAGNVIASSFSNVKDSISNTLNLPRTTTSDTDFQEQDIYVPYQDIKTQWVICQWYNYVAWICMQDPSVCGGTQPDSSFTPSASVSGTLPVIYVNTAGGATINDNENYISGTCYVDSMGIAAYRSNGSASAPLAMQIRGRGNWTWRGFDKKPYKIKLNSGTKILGLHKSKHWALIAAADDNLGFLRNTVGFFLSRRIGLEWTPAQVPVELVLNGQYEGLYFLTETVRIDNKRVDINEQADGSTNPDSITGGWLVEIDNYPSAGNVELTESNGQTVMFTLHDPEVLSSAQRNYLTAQLTALNTAIGQTSTTQMDQLLDLDEAVKYYLVQEIMEDCESYHGSCYLHKDMDGATTEKWKFGPVWDFGNSYNRHLYNGDTNSMQFIYQNPEFAQYWIGTIAQHQSFQTLLMKYWYLFYNIQQDDIFDLIDEFEQQIQYAAQNDALRWNSSSNVNTASNMAQKKQDFLTQFNWRINWLHSQWGDGTPGLNDNPNWTGIAVENSDDTVSSSAVKVVRGGQLLIIRDGRTYNALGQMVE